MERRNKSPITESFNTTIDDLPEGILLHILSFLPTTAAVITSFVARRWRNLWRFVPSLEFHMFEFCTHLPDESLRDGRQLFVQFISQTLLHRSRHSPLEKFSLWFEYKDYTFMRAYVNSWLQYAISSKVTELELYFVDDFPGYVRFFLEKEIDNADDGDIDSYYDFHFFDLINSSVKVLRLNGCDLFLPCGALPMKLDSIREVHLRDFYSNGSEIENLMGLCSNLEVLSLESVWGLQNFKIVSQKLKYLKLNLFEGVEAAQISVDICAPSLATIIFAQFNLGKYTLKDTSSLVEAHVDFDCRGWRDLACWANVVRLLSVIQHLTVQNMWILFKQKSIDGNNEATEKKPKVGSDEESINSEEKLHRQFGEEVFFETFAFNNLKHLELTLYSRYDLLGLEVAFKACPHVETLVLVNSSPPNLNECFGKDMEKISIALQMPCLKLVKMKNYRGAKIESYIVELLKKHGVVLEKIVAFPAKVHGTSSPPFII